MAHTPRLELRQSQTLAMTPQLRQSIAMLQLSLAELEPLIMAELEKNPLLDIAETASDNPDIWDRDEVPEAEQVKNADISDIVNGRAKGEYDTAFGENYQTMWEGEGAHSSALYEPENQAHIDSARSNRAFYEERDYSFEEMESKAMSLHDYVLDQIYLDISEHQARIIAIHLTELLDDNGYLQTGAVAAVAEQLHCDLAEVEAVLAQLQQCDPAGVFARDVKECLTLQLRDRDHLDPATLLLLEHLDKVAEHDMKGLAKLSGLREEDIRDAFEEITHLTPHPGSIFSSERVQTVQPDVFLRKKADGGWAVELNNSALPKLLANKTYYKEVSDRAHKKEEKEYLSEQWNSANWLIRSLDQRAQNILKVAGAIVELQEEFFRKGIRYLKPLTLSTIAQKVEVHESTVSRVVQHKYMATPMGLYEMRYFFSSGLNNRRGGEEHSSRMVQHMIKEMTDNEAADSILSDEDIALLLKAQGIEVARRTVVKYREAMGIPSSVQRRRGVHRP
jgi:RNA polymerase sigma-54 factor